MDNKNNNEDDVKMDNKVNDEIVSMNINEEFAEGMLQQAQLIYKHVKDIKEIHKNMQQLECRMENKISLHSKKMDEFEEKLDNHIFLSPAESNNMSILVRKKAVNFGDYLNDIGYYPKAKDFGDVVKRVMIGIRAMLKIKFTAQRWYMIRHVDFEDAMGYLDNLKVSDFLSYRNRKINRNKRNVVQFEKVTK